MNILRRNLCIALLGGFSLLLFGNLKLNTHHHQRRVLIVGTDQTPPYYQQGHDGKITGVAVDVLSHAAANLNLELRFVHASRKPDECLKTHTVDLWPLLTITAERTASFHMTPPWLYNTLCLLRNNKTAPPSPGNFRLAHTQNQVAARSAQQYFPYARSFPKVTRAEILQAVCLGTVDAGLIETRVLDGLLLSRPKGCETADLSRQLIPGASFPLGIAAVRSAGREADRLHDEITAMAGSGELAEIFAKWAGVTANEANSIIAMNSAKRNTHLAYGGLAGATIAAGVILWQLHRVRRAFRHANRETSERKRAEEARKNADQTRNLVLDGAGEGICGLDSQGRTTFINSAAASLLGLNFCYTEPQDFHALIHGRDLGNCPGSLCNFNAVRRSTTELHVGTAEFWRSNGFSFAVEFTDSPLVDNGVYTGSVVTFKDITERKREEMLDHDRNAVLEMLAENGTLENIFEAIARLVERQLPDFFCSISVVNGGRLELRAAPSLPEPIRQNVRATEIGPRSRSCGAAAYWSKPVSVSDIAVDPLWEMDRSAAASCDLASCWSHPIVSASSVVLGTVAIYGRSAGPPDTSHQILLKVACRLSRLAIEQIRLTQQLHFQAHHDSLTGLPNRLLLEEHLRQALDAARHTQSLCAVFYIDLDRFKQVNDTLSHRVGDLYLCQVAKRLENAIPAAATLARLGGDEFAIVIPAIENTAEADRCGSALLEAMAQPFSVEGYTLFGTASIGISFSSARVSVAELQSCADQAMYQAKNQGRNQYRFYSEEMSSRAHATLAIEQALRSALENNGFILYYQPQCRANGDLLGFEALIRLMHPERGMISPADFIPVAEDTGLIIPIGSWVLRESCRQLALWHAQGLSDVTISINVSAAQFAQGNFAAEVAKELHDHSLDPSGLEIELTESMIMSNFEECLTQMKQLRQLGVKLSIDDFGTGYSSLSYLHRLPIHTIKIDQSFVRAIDSEVSTRPLVEAIFAAARSLQYHVIAEGVETEAQRRDLARIGCDHMQGYFFSRPLPAQEVMKQYRAVPSERALLLAS